MTASLVATAGFRCDDLAGWQTVCAEGWNWKIRPDHADEWQRQLLFHPLKSSTGTIIKRGPHRTVRRLDALTGGGTYFLKVFHRSGWRTRWKQLLRGVAADWEFSRYRLAVRRQVPTAEVVAVGFQTGWSSQSALVTRGIEQAFPLDDWLRERPQKLTVVQRRALAEELGELIARLHSRGVVHRDLHGGNILLRPAPGGFRLWLVDLAPLRFLRECPAEAVLAQNLGRLRHSVLEQLSQADQAAFFHAYWRLFSGNAVGKVLPWRGDQHFAWRELSYRCDEVARCAWEEMDRAWNRGNSKQIVIKTPRILARGLARFGRDQLEARCRLADPEGSSLETIPMASRQMTAEPLETALRVVTRPASSSSPAGASWARHCWNIGHALARRWISAPVPVYVLESRSPGVDWGEVAFAKELGWTLLSSQTSEWERIAPGAIDLLKRFHNLGFTHAALSLSAIEVCQADGRWQCRFGSLDFIQQARTVSLSQRCADLQPLAADLSRRREVSLSMQLRWLKRCLAPNASAQWKNCWRAISPSIPRPMPKLRAA